MTQWSEAVHFQGRTMSCLLSEAWRHNLSEITSARRDSPSLKCKTQEEAVNTRTVSHKLTLRVKESLSRRSTRTSRTKCLSEAGSSLTSVTRQELRILFCFIYMSLFSCISCFYSYKYDLCLHFLSLLHVCTCTLSNLITWSPEPGRSPVGVTGTGDWWCGPTAGPTTWAKW